MLKIGAIVGMLVVIVQLSLAQKCNECMDNNVQCTTETEYYLCIGGKKLGPRYCDEDTVCSNSDEICVKKDELTADIKNVCGDDNGLCQACPTGRKFTCASKTQGALCSAGKINTNAIFDCEKDEICNVEAGDKFGTVCMSNCAADFAKLTASCSNVAYTPPTLTPPTTPGQTEMQTICRDAAAGKTAKYFFTYADPTCRSYVYCERKSSSTTQFDTTFTGSCSSPKIYFNTASGTCQSTMPDSCRALSSTPTPSIR